MPSEQVEREGTSVLSHHVAARVSAFVGYPWARDGDTVRHQARSTWRPHGVTWAFMAFIANYRGLKRGDDDALRLAQPRPKYSREPLETP